MHADSQRTDVSTDRGKRRTVSQRIGLEGEKVFELWASKQGLTANRVEEDLGIDFFCQVLMPVGLHRSEEVTGSILAVQVKTVENETTPSVILDRVDVANLLKQNHATCIVGVHLGDQAICFRFLNIEEIDRLLAFLASSNKTYSIPFEAMDSNDAAFRKELRHLARPGVQQRLRVHLIHKRITHELPGAEVVMSQGEKDGFTRVSVPWFGSGFNVDQHALEVVKTRVFERGELPIGIPGVSLKPEIMSAFELADGPGFLIGKHQGLHRITVEYQGKMASTTFIVRVLGTDAAYVHPAGLRISFSERREDPKLGWVHDVEVAVFARRRKTPLAGPILSFLRLLRPGATFVLGPKDRRPIEEVFGAHINLGSAVEGVQRLSEALHFDFDDFQLADLKNEEYARTLAFLHGFLLDSVPLEGFIGGLNWKVAEERLRALRATLTVPLAMNWKEKGVAIWVRCEATALIANGGQCRGFNIDRQLDWRIQPHPMRFNKSKYPELWFAKSWPALPIGLDFDNLPPPFRNQESQIILEAELAVAES